MFYVECGTYLALSPLFVHVDNVSKPLPWKSDWVVNIRLVASLLLQHHNSRSVWCSCWSLVSRHTTKVHILPQTNRMLQTIGAKINLSVPYNLRR
jgi:hypothetical protein